MFSLVQFLFLLRASHMETSELEDTEDMQRCWKKNSWPSDKPRRAVTFTAITQSPQLVVMRVQMLERTGLIRWVIQLTTTAWCLAEKKPHHPVHCTASWQDGSNRRSCRWASPARAQQPASAVSLVLPPGVQASTPSCKLLPFRGTLFR